MVVNVCTMGSVLPAVNDGAVVVVVVVGLWVPLIKLGTKSEGVAEVEEEAEEEDVVMGAAAVAAWEVVGDMRGGVAVPLPPAGEGSFLMNASSAGNRAKMVLRSIA